MRASCSATQNAVYSTTGANFWEIECKTGHPSWHTTYVPNVHARFHGVMSTPWGPKKSLCLCKKLQFWKFKARRVVSDIFEHADFDGARKSRFQAILGVENLICLFNAWGQTIKRQKLHQMGVLRYVKWWEDSKSGLRIQ